MVVFCGCGCQVAGLYATLKNVDISNLYTIDLMCHGGPSPKLFDDYLNKYHGKDQGKVADVGFRDKDYFGWSTEMTVKYTELSVNLKLLATSRRNPSNAHRKMPSASAFIFSARSGSSALFT